jgi:hypothetical protein
MSAQIIQFPTPKPVAPFKTLDDAAWYSNFGKRLATIRKLLEIVKAANGSCIRCTPCDLSFVGRRLQGAQSAPRLGAAQQRA